MEKQEIRDLYDELVVTFLVEFKCDDLHGILPGLRILNNGKWKGGSYNIHDNVITLNMKGMLNIAKIRKREVVENAARVIYHELKHWHQHSSLIARNKVYLYTSSGVKELKGTGLNDAFHKGKKHRPRWQHYDVRWIEQDAKKAETMIYKLHYKESPSGLK